MDGSRLYTLALPLLSAGAGGQLEPELGVRQQLQGALTYGRGLHTYIHMYTYTYRYIYRYRHGQKYIYIYTYTHILDLCMAVSVHCGSFNKGLRAPLKGLGGDTG